MAKLALLVLPVCRLVGRGKAKCTNVRWQNFKIFCVVAKKIKREALSCRVGKSPLLSLYVVLAFRYFSVILMVVVSVFTLAYNS
jgi:hypothetical protein